MLCAIIENQECCTSCICYQARLLGDLATILVVKQVWESHSKTAISFAGRTAAGEVAFDVDMGNMSDALHRRLADLPPDRVTVCSGIRVSERLRCFVS